MPCSYCNTEFYIKTKQYCKPLLAPLTIEGELRQQLQDLTGEIYLKIKPEYCPMCGGKLRGENNA